MKPSLPILPPAGANLIARLLISPDTQPDLAWPLLGAVDLSSTIDGKPLLQVFCEERRNGSVFRKPLDGQMFPTSPDEPWPDPRDEKGNWHSHHMWVAASLIISGPDPYAWKTDEGLDVMDFALLWGNDHLFRQLMAMPGAPTPDAFSGRFFQEKSWLHRLSSKSSQHFLLSAVLEHEVEINLADKKGDVPLHVCSDHETVECLVKAPSIDLFAVNKGERTPPEEWLARFVKGQDITSYEGRLAKMMSSWMVAAISVDRDRAEKVAVKLIAPLLKKGYCSVAEGISQQFDKPLSSWRINEGGRDIGMIGFLAIEAMRRGGKSLTGLRAILKTARREDATYSSYKQLPDISLAWAAMRSSTTALSQVVVKSALGGMMERHGFSQDEIEKEVLHLAFSLAKSTPFNGEKVNTKISEALGLYADDLGKQMRGDAPVSATYDLLFDKPDLLPAILNEKMASGPLGRSLDAVSRLAYGMAPDRQWKVFEQVLGVATYKAFANPSDVFLHAYFYEATERLVQYGVRPRLSENLSRALAPLQDKAGDIKSQGLAALLEEVVLAENTAPVLQSPSSRPFRL